MECNNNGDIFDVDVLILIYWELFFLWGLINLVLEYVVIIKCCIVVCLLYDWRLYDIVGVLCGIKGVWCGIFWYCNIIKNI